MDFLEKLNHLMSRDGYNKHTLSINSGVPYTTIDGWYKKGYNRAKVPTIQKLSSFFNVSLDYLMDDSIDDENYGKQKNNIIPFPAASLSCAWGAPILEAYASAILPTQEAACNVLQIPYVQPRVEEDVVPFRVSENPAAAGTGIYLGPESFYEIYVNVSRLPVGAAFGVPVRGDSMEPNYHDGDILIVSKDEPRVGEIGVFTLDGDGYVKERGHGELISLNKKYPPIAMNESIRCNGKVIGVLDQSE